MSKLAVGEKNAALGASVVKDMLRHGRFFLSEERTPYYLHTAGDQNHLISLDPTDPDYKQFILRTYRIDGSSQEYGMLYNWVEGEAKDQPKVPIHRLSYFDRRNKVLYVNRYDGYMYRLDGHRIETLANGDEDVLFVADDSARAWSFIPTDDTTYPTWKHEVFAGFNLVTGQHATQQDVHHVMWTWVISMFFPELMPTTRTEWTRCAVRAR